MGFDPNTKEKAYIASARRCCVCKNFKGRNIEVHHIIQKADGGEDSYENAIPLCFDCHAEAGHYNPRHPKGAKYSPTELRAHRDYWYRVVADGKIHIESVQLTHQYYLTNSFDIVTEVVNGDFGNFPIDHIKLIKNELYTFLKSACDFQKGRDRESNIGGNTFASVNEYTTQHGDAKLIETPWGISQWERDITLEEIAQKLAPIDFVSNYMVRHGARPTDIAKVQFNEHGCCESFFEEYILRGAKVVFLAITNTTEEELACQSIIENITDNNDFAEVGSASGNINELNLNNIPFAPGECVLIPSCIVLTPFSHGSYTPQNAITHGYVDSGETQDTREVTIDSFGEYPTIGPYHQISSVNIVSMEQTYNTELRPLMMNSLFMISRYWECGSCPHLFIQNKGSTEWQYKGEVFSIGPDETQTFFIDRGKPEFESVKRIKIIELESETTHIESILVDKKVVCENITLNINEVFEIDIENSKLVEIVGYYTLHAHVNYKNSNQIKYQKVYHTLRDINQSCLTKQIQRPAKCATADL